MYSRDPDQRALWIICQLRAYPAQFNPVVRSAHEWLKNIGLGSDYHAVQRLLVPLVKHSVTTSLNALSV